MPCDKLRYEAIARPDLLADGAPLTIRIVPDAKAQTLTIKDTGIGMDRQELIDQPRDRGALGHTGISGPPVGGQGRRRLDRAVWRRLLLGFHRRRIGSRW